MQHDVKILLPSEITLPSGKSGSHQHYYHFLLGNLLPLFDYIGTGTKCDASDFSEIASFDPGPFRHMLTCLGIRTLDRQTLLKLTQDLIDVSRIKQSRRSKEALSVPLITHDIYSHLPRGSLVSTRDPSIQCIRLQGFDHPTVYQHDKITSAAAKIMRFLSIDEMVPENAGDDAVVFVNRGQSDAFYSSPEAHRRTSGAARRSLPNSAEIVFAVERHWKVREVLLERMDFKKQIGIFRNAKVIIAQHGAALSNLVWCRPGSTVIEINPYDEDVQWFEPLAKAQGMNHLRIQQHGEHGAVSPDAVVNSLAGVWAEGPYAG